MGYAVWLMVGFAFTYKLEAFPAVMYRRRLEFLILHNNHTEQDLILFPL